ncbi:hypothetical protein [Saccharopolyspora erythraea]|uniref:Uncharacterized protein n=2 Tax=Saccharopolyspora erythraea TaxID=1836 RepID=A4FL11_SACEN|nr:hypothetical protein [Saccharopolyspora erythraea]QRK88446.1 hypothetical protein JQX30_27830 [Saccharopolyspora erythraea]CAM04736.1 hypothetical protein SACE_5550 [Saccharopolyspora erythraea NRRL 2338]
MAASGLRHPAWCKDTELEERIYEQLDSSVVIHFGKAISVGRITVRLFRTDVHGEPGPTRVSIRCVDRDDLTLEQARQLTEDGRLQEFAEALQKLIEEAGTDSEDGSPRGPHSGSTGGGDQHVAGAPNSPPDER